MHEIIFEADTFWGKAFDVALLIAIALSIIVVMLESVREIESGYGDTLRIIEWVFTILFTLEYIARLLSVLHPSRYALSGLGLIDLLSIIPTYLSLFVAGSQTFLVIRTLRLLRVFRIFKLARYLGAAKGLVKALRASRTKIIVFVVFVVSLSVILGTFMYLIEGRENGFTSIPGSIYWAIVTLTTVGYGDIAPQTVLGQLFATIIMIMGYGIIAVPTGIVTVELAGVWQGGKVTTRACANCSQEGHDEDAEFCKHCGYQL